MGCGNSETITSSPEEVGPDPTATTPDGKPTRQLPADQPIAKDGNASLPANSLPNRVDQPGMLIVDNNMSRTDAELGLPRAPMSPTTPQSGFGYNNREGDDHVGELVSSPLFRPKHHHQRPGSLFHGGYNNVGMASVNYRDGFSVDSPSNKLSSRDSNIFFIRPGLDDDKPELDDETESGYRRIVAHDAVERLLKAYQNPSSIAYQDKDDMLDGAAELYAHAFWMEQSEQCIQAVAKGHTSKLLYL